MDFVTVRQNQWNTSHLQSYCYAVDRRTDMKVILNLSFTSEIKGISFLSMSQNKNTYTLRYVLLTHVEV